MPDQLLSRAIVLTFCGVMLAVFGALLAGLFVSAVDNVEVFKMIGHDFDLILVALTSYLGGRASAPVKSA